MERNLLVWVPGKQLPVCPYKNIITL